MENEPGEVVAVPHEQSKPTGPPMPVCGFCGLDPCVPDMIDVTFGLFIGKMFICPNRDCRKLFNVELVGQKQPQIVAPPGRMLRQ
jgi:hypothetical protein